MVPILTLAASLLSPQWVSWVFDIAYTNNFPLSLWYLDFVICNGRNHCQVQTISLSPLQCFYFVWFHWLFNVLVIQYQSVFLPQVSIELVRQELSLPTLPVLVLSDAFDTLTIGQCEKLFGFVEDNVSVWKEDQFFAPCKNSVLRMCNGWLYIKQKKL